MLTYAAIAIFAAIHVSDLIRGLRARRSPATRRLEAALRNEEFVPVSWAYKAPRA